ncbi:hypothetical protein BS50DRAFT_396869 [Corynespora cassiicola Philippines]|uniref:Uncharacterized protein n=1 Tax=Corynespora cassiicola Philippines TaxID=1448308 RepID=A0A2T2NK56_CORCC|nr:hypothetical protein BS50DRAFT_396869 [Corynespora cassiicola Philippines]
MGRLLSKARPARRWPCFCSLHGATPLTGGQAGRLRRMAAGWASGFVMSRPWCGPWGFIVIVEASNKGPDCAVRLSWGRRFVGHVGHAGRQPAGWPSAHLPRKKQAVMLLRAACCGCESIVDSTRRRLRRAG